MFISEEEADRRVNSNANLLRRLKIPLVRPEDRPEIKSEIVKEVDIALDQTANDPTLPTEDDAVRLAILAGRRHLKTSDERGGRYPQQGNVPPIFRSLIGAAAKLGTAQGAARSWGVNPTMAHHYKHGRTGQDAPEDLTLSQAIDHNVLVVRSQVLDLLSTTVAEITPEKLENRNAQELSAIARNLSAIISSTRASQSIEQTNNAQVIVFTPEAEKETQYETIEIE